MKTSVMVTGLSLAMLAGVSKAGTVSDGDINTFAAGNSISSAEMNTNFNAVKGAVNGNADDISTLNSTINELQTTISSLQSSISDLETSLSDVKGRLDLNDAYITLNEMVGKTYCLVSQNTTLTWDSVDNWARVNVGNDARTLTVTSESEVTLASGEYKEGELGFGVGYESPDYALNAELQTWSDTEASQTIGISSFADGVLTLSVGIELFVSKRGDMLVGREFSETVDEDNNSAPQRDVSTIMMVQCR